MYIYSMTQRSLLVYYSGVLLSNKLKITLVHFLILRKTILLEDYMGCVTITVIVTNIGVMRHI